MCDVSAYSVRILLVEDTSDDEALTLRALSQVNVKVAVDVCRDGQRAAEYLLRNEFPLQLILLDIKLPKVNGIELLKVARATRSYHLTPVVMLTSSDELADIQNSYETGANAFVRKPIDYEEYVSAVQNLVEFWVRYNLCRTTNSKKP